MAHTSSESILGAFFLTAIVGQELCDHQLRSNEPLFLRYLYTLLFMLLLA